MRKSRLERQREYQRRYREMKKAKREPDRDEIARELLHYAIVKNLSCGRGEELWRLVGSISERLVARGYDPDATARAFDALVERYATGWEFQTRLHLRPGAEFHADIEE